MTMRATPGGGAKTPRLPAESAAAAPISGTAVTSESTVSMPSPTTSEARPSAGRPESRTAHAEDPAERLARRRDARLGGPARIEPGALHAEDGAVIAGDGGDQRREPAHGRAFAIAKLGMEAQRAKRQRDEAARVEIGFGVGAVDRAALPPQAARRFGGVVVGPAARGRRNRQGEEGARLVERRAQRRCAGCGGG